MSIRTLVSLEEADKTWLDEQAKERAQPMTLVVREAVAEYRVRQDSRAGEPLQALLEHTAGLFTRRGTRAEDGLAIQQRLRAEWAEAASANKPPKPPKPRGPPKPSSRAHKP